MIKWITPYYLMPNSQLFKTLAFLNRYFKAVVFGASFTILACPCFQWISAAIEQEDLAEQIAQINTQITQQTQLYQAMKQHQQQLDSQNNDLAAISQQVETLLKQQNVVIERLQWQTEEGKTLTLVAQQQAIPLFRSIERLNQLTGLRAKSLLLTKLNEDRQVQLVMTFMLTKTAKKEEKREESAE